MRFNRRINSMSIESGIESRLTLTLINLTIQCLRNVFFPDTCRRNALIDIAKIMRYYSTIFPRIFRWICKGLIVPINRAN